MVLWKNLFRIKLSFEWYIIWRVLENFKFLHIFADVSTSHDPIKCLSWKNIFLGHPDHVYQFPCFYHKLKYPGAKTPIINVFKVNNKNTGIKSTHLVLVTLLLPLTVNFEQTEPAVRRCFQNGVLKNFAIFTRKYMWFKVALQACNFIRKSLQHSCFPVKIVKFLRIVFYTTPPVAASWTQLAKNSANPCQDDHFPDCSRTGLFRVSS